MSDLPQRPAAPRTLRDRLREWIAWVGAGRVVGGAVTVLAVLAAAYWLVAPPPATSESRLPFATSSGARSAATADTASTGSGSAGSGSAVPRSQPASTGGDVVVHVAGAVAHAGVYHLAGGSRVVDAVTAAGGPVADADTDAVNLAAVLTDGERVYVPRVGEVVAPPVESAPAGPLNLNTADADALDSLPGVGPSTAAAIIAERDAHGPFASVDDLARVKGIGPAKIEALRGLVTT